MGRTCTLNSVSTTDGTAFTPKLHAKKWSEAEDICREVYGGEATKTNNPRGCPKAVSASLSRRRSSFDPHPSWLKSKVLVLKISLQRAFEAPTRNTPRYYCLKLIMTPIFSICSE